MNERSQYLGGSDVAGILGLSQWANPVDIYYRKVGYPADGTGRPDPMREKILRRGKFMEPVVVKMVAAEYPIKITKRSSEKKPNRYRDKKLPFLGAEIDFEWNPTLEMRAAYPGLPDLMGPLNGEVKTSMPFSSRVYGEEGTDEIPVAYACQAMHGLGITGRDACLVPVLVGSDELRLYHVLRNDDLIRLMREKCERFWTDYVLPRKLPPVVDNGDVYRILRTRNDTIVQADEKLVMAINVLAGARQLKKEAEEREDKAQFEVIKHLVGENATEGPTAEGRHVVMYGAEKLLTLTKQSRDNVQGAALKAAHPEIYAEVVKTSSFFVCRLNRSN